MFTTEPKVSVVMPVYNCALYLPESLKSLREQTFTSYEVLCVDDGSTDASAEIIESTAKADGRFIYLYQENQGAGSARNHGLALAKGEFVIFLDADDMFDCNLLSKLYSRCTATNSDICICEAVALDTRTNKTRPLISLSRMADADGLPAPNMESIIFQRCGSAPWNKIFRRSYVVENGLLFQNLPRANDYYFVCKALALTTKISFVEEPLIQYRYNTGVSLQDQKAKNATCVLEANSALYESLADEKTMGEEKWRSLRTRSLGAFFDAFESSVGEIKALEDVYSVFTERLQHEWGIYGREASYFTDKKLAFKYACLNLSEKSDFIWAYKPAQSDSRFKGLLIKAAVALRLSLSAAKGVLRGRRIIARNTESDATSETV